MKLFELFRYNVVEEMIDGGRIARRQHAVEALVPRLSLKCQVLIQWLTIM